MLVYQTSEILLPGSKKGNEQERVYVVDPFTAEDNNDCDDTTWMRLSGRRSKVWKHFRANRNDRTRVKCDHCPSVFTYSSSTTDFWRHLDSAHNIGKSGFKILHRAPRLSYGPGEKHCGCCAEGRCGEATDANQTENQNVIPAKI